MTSTPEFDREYSLDDVYTRESGRVYITGVQALVRLPLMQARRDRAAGLRTAGFISGYRGSPLGTYDMALWRAKESLAASDVRFEPGVNEDLAATAVWGSQQANLYPGPRYDGVFAIWYGKGPGVDRSCDALKHGNHAGSAANGGVLVLCGDDPGARSSSIAHQSEPALVHCGIPVLHPCDVQEYLDLGIQAFALSRYSGCWIGFKCLTDTVDSARSVEADPERVRIVIPHDHALPPGGLNIGWSNLPLQVETRLFQDRHAAVHAFVRANGIDRVEIAAPRPRLGIVTTGKAYLDVRQALVELGISDERARTLGLCLYKVALTWPLEPQGALAFCDGLEDVLVVEEKRAFVEDQLARLLYNQERRPRLLGKTDENGAPLVPAQGELAPRHVAEALRGWLERRIPELAGKLRPGEPVSVSAPAGELMRLPGFCSGCPHSTSTHVPDDSLALGGIGCHGMAVWLPDRHTLAVTQMGGEGANWIGAAAFTETPHIFQNIGDGTYFHSGLLAIRAAVTAGVNITYKVLANGAVAMTGGQRIEGEVLEGEITVPQIVRQLDAEGVRRIAVVSVEPAQYARGAFPAGVTTHPRDALDAVQRELREVSGVSAIVYDQVCAAEARRLRKRGAFPDPDRRVVINELVCEGCGDCSVQSSCISIEPVETEFGRKRRINQSSCNKDFSCVKGYCPSFVSVIGGRLHQARADVIDPEDDTRFASLPTPLRVDAAQPYNVLVAGVGGSGVVTVGAILAMAAHLEGRGCSELDVTGLAQKNGPVASHVRIANDPGSLHAPRISDGAADLLIGCDIVVTTSLENRMKLSPGRTTAVINSHVTPTAAFATDPDLDLSSTRMEEAVGKITRDCHVVPATPLATALLGDAIAGNHFLLGYAFQCGRLPVGLGSVLRAIELNGRAVAMNRRAFAWGRLAAHDLDAVTRAARPGLPDEAAPGTRSLEEIVAHRVEALTAYQNARYARRYQAMLEQVAIRERDVGAGDGLGRAVAEAYFKLLAYKDEYEVARLYSDGSFQRQLEREFEGDYRLRLHLSPQFLPRWLARPDRTGRSPKITLGSWMFRVFGVLARLRFLRGTPFDPFGRTRHRRLERQLIRDYEATLAEILQGLGSENHALAVEIASLPDLIRGFDIVKEQSLETARGKQEELLAAFRLRSPPPAGTRLG